MTTKRKPKETVMIPCGGCRKNMELTLSEYRRRTAKSKHPLCCSRRCAGLQRAWE